MRTLVVADDFGMTEDQSRALLALAGDGCALDKVSWMVNGPAAPACARLLEGVEGLEVGLHVNLVEGPCCADPAKVPLLVDGRGMFSLGFAGMLLMSAGPRRHELARQVQLEIEAQLDRFLAYRPAERGALSVDSHQHAHLIPVVFRALGSAIGSRGCSLARIRIPAEPLLPFLQAPSALLAVPPVNWVKHALLNALWAWNRWRGGGFARMARERSAVFLGIALSGRMTERNLARVLPRAARYAAARGRDLEALFHPSGLASADEALDPELSGFVAFYRSPYRELEREALRSRLVAEVQGGAR